MVRPRLASARAEPLRRKRVVHGRPCGILRVGPNSFLLTDDYLGLIYYIRPHPLDAVKWKVTSRIQDQWDLTNGLGKRLGESFLLVSEHELTNEMEPSFAAIERLRPIAIPLGPGAVRTYTLYVARGFKGYPPGRT